MQDQGNQRFITRPILVMYYSDYQEDVMGGYFPIHATCTRANIRKIYVGINSTVARPGCYLQGAGTIRFGDYVQLAPNVGILSANHD